MRNSFGWDRSGSTGTGLTGRTVRAARMGVLLLLCMCFVFSGCVMEDGAAKKEIELVVDGLMTDIQDGSFADDEFVSECVTDGSFSQAKYPDEKIRGVVENVMADMTYKIVSVEGSTREKIGTCQIDVTALDYVSVLDGTDMDTLTIDGFLKLVDDNWNRTKKKQIVLGMAYDEAAKKWTIADLKPLFDVVVGPCSTLDLPVNYGTFIDSFFDMLRYGTYDEFQNVSCGYQLDEFYSPYYSEDDIWVEFFKLTSFELVEEHVNKKTGEIVVDVKVTYPDLAAIDSKLLTDHDLLCKLYELYVLDRADGGTQGHAFVKLLDTYKEPFIEALHADDVPMITEESSFTLLKPALAEKGRLEFLVQEAPEFLLYKEVIFANMDPDFSQACMTETIEYLIAEGLVERSEIEAASS